MIIGTIWLSHILTNAFYAHYLSFKYREYSSELTSQYQAPTHQHQHHHPSSYITIIMMTILIVFIIIIITITPIIMSSTKSITYFIFRSQIKHQVHHTNNHNYYHPHIHIILQVCSQWTPIWFRSCSVPLVSCSHCPQSPCDPFSSYFRVYAMLSSVHVCACRSLNSFYPLCHSVTQDMVA